MPNFLIFALTIATASHVFASLGSYTAKELHELANREGHTRIENLLARISGEQDLITLNARTRDPEQYSDDEHPRLIASSHPFFGAPKSVIAVAGKKGEKGWDRILMLERGSGTVAFVPHVLEFPTERTGRKAAVIWHRAPPACLKCHGAVITHDSTTPANGALPLWDAYPILPGFYGEEEGDENSPSWTRMEKNVRGLADKERYRVLRIPVHSYPDLTTGPHPHRFYGTSRAQLHRDLSGDIAALGQFFTQRNAVRIFQILRNAPAYRVAVPALLACGFDAPNDFFASVAKRAFGSAPTDAELDALTERAALLLNRYYDNQIERKIRFEDVAKQMSEAELQKFRYFLQTQVAMTQQRKSLSAEYNARFQWTLKKLGLGHIKYDLTLENSGAVQGSNETLHQQLGQLILNEEFRREPKVAAHCEPSHRTRWMFDNAGSSARGFGEVWTLNRDRMENFIRYRTLKNPPVRSESCPSLLHSPGPIRRD